MIHLYIKIFCLLVCACKRSCVRSCICVNAYTCVHTSKAYDCISHDLLVRYIEAYWLHKNALKLVHSFLTNRMQRIKTGSTYSSSKQISNGIPQGSILEPLLFKIFINYFFLIETDLEIRNLADGTTIYACDTSIEVFMTRLEIGLNMRL